VLRYDQAYKMILLLIYIYILTRNLDLILYYLESKKITY
jgi:hypothetical protein